MNELNSRFIEFYNYLISQNIVKSGKEFSENTGVSSSLITEITHGRSIAGTKVIQNSVIKYRLNSDWLFTGNGLMIKDDQKEDETSIKVIDNSSMGFILDRYEALAVENALLKKENEDLKQSRGKFYDAIPYTDTPQKLSTSIAAEPAHK
jgi:hypothetical protein